MLRSGNPYIMGVKESGVSEKDYVAPRQLVASAPPPKAAVEGMLELPVKSQQGSTCVGNSNGSILEYFYWREHHEVVSISGEELNGRVVHQEGAAASPHDVLDDLVKHGARVELENEQGLVYPAAYAWVDRTDKTAIMSAMSTAGVMLTASCWLLSNFGAGGNNPNYGPGVNNGGKEYTHDIPGEKSEMYHELTFVAYDEQGVIYKNSWDTWWGDNGFGRLAWDYVQSDRIGELWAVTDNPDTAGGFIKTYDYGNASETAIARFDLPTRKRPAVYLVKPDGRIWIKNPFEAKRFGVKLPPVRVADTDGRWALPVIGPDAPKDLR
jgi:hypothetical protein